MRHLRSASMRLGITKPGIKDRFMPETYTITPVDGNVSLEIRENDLPPALLRSDFRPDQTIKGIELTARFGDPNLLECLVWRRNKMPGGIFIVREKGAVLFGAVADSALAYALGLGYFGELTANARYGADIFENMEEPDD